MALMGTLVDTFDTTFDLVKWGRTISSIVVSGGQLHIPSDTGAHRASSAVTYDLTNSFAMVEIVTRPPTGAALLCGRTVPGNNANEVSINIAENGLMYARHAVGGVETFSTNVTWSPITHRWLRIRHASGTVFFETSPDSVTFTPFFSMTPTLTLTALYAEVGAGADATAADLVVDNFNSPITGPPVTGLTGFFRYFNALFSAGLPASAGGSLLFNGDYLVGNFSQWNNVQNKDYNGVGSGYTPSSYAAVVQADPTYGQCARIELRNGDIALGGTDELAEVRGTTAQTGGLEGDIRWYEFATKFDAAFPPNHASSGFWGVTNQWHHTNPLGAPPIGWYVDRVDGQWSLVVNRQSAPNVYLSQTPIYHAPLIPAANQGWNDIRMEIKFSVSDAVGYIRVWHNGNRVTFLDGSQTYSVRTLVPGDTAPGGSYYKEGYARDPAMVQTGILHQTNFKCAAAEAPLGPLMSPVGPPPVTPPPTTTASNRPVNAWLIAYDDNAVPTPTIKAQWSKPGAIVVSGRNNFGAQWFKDVAAAGATNLMYFHPGLFNPIGRYANLMYNASTYGPGIAPWPANAAGSGPWVIDEWGYLPNFKLSNTAYWNKLPQILNLMLDENPHCAGFFFDGLGSRHWPGAGGFDWDTWPTSEREEYRNGNIKVCQVARGIADARNLMLIVNGQWQGWGAAGEGNGGYPDRTKHGMSLVDGIMFENRPPSGPGNFAYEYAVNSSNQWGIGIPRIAAMPNPKGYIVSGNALPADRDAWVAFNAVSHAFSGNDYSTIVAPWKTTFTDMGLPNRKL